MPRTPDSQQRTDRYAYDGLDRVIHERARLGLLTSLAAHAKGLRFAELKELCGLTDGNLSRHLQVLEAAGLGVEAMDTPAACRTYNVILSEGRRIAAAVLPV